MINEMNLMQEDKLTIAFIVDSISRGGAGRVVSRLANRLKERFRVSILTVFDGTCDYEVEDGVLHRSLVNKGEDLKDSFSLRIRRIREYCQQEQVDVVISFLTEINVYAILAGMKQKWKTIISERNDPHNEPPDKRVRLLRKLFYGFADGYVFQTENARNYYCDKIAKKGCVIPNPISDDIPAPYAGVRTKRIVSVGRLHKQKNYELAINAFARIAQEFPDYSYEIYGDGAERMHLQEIVADLGLEDRINFMGHCTNVLAKIYDAELFVMSSNYEGLSNALIEAVAIGLPIISTDHPIGGARATITEGANGYLVPTNDVQAFSETMREYLNGDSRLDITQQSIEKFRERLDIKNICDEWTSYIQMIIGDDRRHQ